MKPTIPDLRNVKRKAVSIRRPEDIFSIDILGQHQNSAIAIMARSKYIDLVEYSKQNRSFIEEKMSLHGAILFRGFNITSPEQCESVLQAVCGELLEYSNRSTPRRSVKGKIYTSTEYPHTESIPLHNEMSYNLEWPLRLCFGCIVAPQHGGETPIADSRRVYARIPESIRERFAKVGVMYVRNYNLGVDLTWQEVFQTESRDQVEAYCLRAGIAYEWLEGDGLRTVQTCQGVVQHPQTSELSWFNQAHLFHVSNLGQALREAMAKEYRPADLPRNAYFGDGAPIEPKTLDVIREAYQHETLTFVWEAGDLLLLDNILTAHGRNPYSGPRQIVVGMAQLCSSAFGSTSLD